MPLWFQFCPEFQVSGGADGWRSIRWFLWKLRAMPNCNNPNSVGFDFIKKSIWRNYHLPVWKFWKLWYNSSGFRKILKSSQDFFGFISKTDRS